MIRYRIDILAELKKAGFSSYKMRQKKLLSEGTLQKIRTGNTTITVSNLNEICSLLHCQPGDLLEFIPDDLDYEPEKEPIASSDEKILEILGELTGRLDKMENRLDEISKHVNM